MDQLIYPPWFLAQYQRWWSIGRPLSVVDIEFTVLLLRICSYASQFLPSPSYTIDRIRGMALADIRNTCDDIANNLAATCVRLDARGSLLRVQHLAFAGLRSMCEGRTSAFWEVLSCAIRVAQRVGIHSDATTWMHDMDELEKEMRRRTFCNLYIWDRYEDWHRESAVLLTSLFHTQPSIKTIRPHSILAWLFECREHAPHAPCARHR